MTMESRQFDVVSILTGLFALAYIGGALYGLIAGKLSIQEYLAMVGTPALPLFGYWAKAKQ